MTRPEEEATPFRKVSSVQELIELIDLEDIRIVELYGSSETEPETESDPDDGTLDFELQYAHADDGLECLVRIGATARRGTTVLSVKVVAVYSISEPIAPLNDQVTAQFVNEVALYQVTPYLRESLMTTASRLRVPAPVLPLTRATEIESVSRAIEATRDENAGS